MGLHREARLLARPLVEPRLLAPGRIRLTRRGREELAGSAAWRGLLQAGVGRGGLLAMAWRCCSRWAWRSGGRSAPGSRGRAVLPADHHQPDPRRRSGTAQPVPSGSLPRSSWTRAFPSGRTVPAPDGRCSRPTTWGSPSWCSPPTSGMGGRREGVSGLAGRPHARLRLRPFPAHDRHPRASLGAALLVGVSAPTLVYATQVSPEAPAALCVVILVLLTLRPGAP